MQKGEEKKSAPRLVLLRVMMSSPSLVSCPAQMWRTVHQSLVTLLLVNHIEELSGTFIVDSIWWDSGIGLFLKGKSRSHLPLPVKFPERRDITARTSLASERESFSYLILGLPLCEAGVSQTTHYFTSTCMFLLMQITSKQSIVRIHGHFIPTNVAQEASTQSIYKGTALKSRGQVSIYEISFGWGNIYSQANILVKHYC